MADWAAAFWDVGGVLLDLSSVRASHRAFVRDLVETRDLAVEPDEAQETWRSVVREYFASREELAFRPAREAYDLAVEAIVGEPVPREDWFPAFRRAGRRHLRANPGAVETVDRLAETDLHLGVISDVDADEGQFILEHLGVRGCFDAVTTSEAVGHTKPHPAMFETALDAAGVPADATVHVGDRYAHDVEGAAARGIHPIAYGADPGPATEYVVDDLSEVLDVLGVE